MKVLPSPNWSRAMPPGPDTRVRITEAYARLVARDAYFWAWPMVNIYNRRLSFAQCPEPGLMNGVLPFAPLNRLSMLHDYIKPEQRWVACPNQDVAYGAAICSLETSPVVVQVPDSGERFWVYQVVDLRTDGFAKIGKMYGTQPGFYLLTSTDWQGEVPQGIAQVFRSKTNTAFVVPRVFMDDTAEDRKAILSVVSGINVYPLSEYDGKFVERDWTKLRVYQPEQSGDTGESKWGFPEKFFDQLPAVLDDAPPLPGEESRYAAMRSMIAAAQNNPELKKALIDEATKCEEELVDPLLQFRNWGVQLGNGWSTTSNNAAFGTDYFARTACAKSNILVNAPRETKYIYQDLDSKGERLNGANRYTLTFAKDQTPPAYGFWSLTLYDETHFFVPNERANWLPAPKGDFTPYLRAYWPKVEVIDGSWAPPPVDKAT